MNIKFAVATVGVLAMISAPAHSLTLTNDDEIPYEVGVIVGEGDAATMRFDLEAGGSRYDFCEDGCTIRLDNGAEQSFDGGEIVTIQDGGFVLSE